MSVSDFFRSRREKKDAVQYLEIAQDSYERFLRLVEESGRKRKEGEEEKLKVKRERERGDAGCHLQWLGREFTLDVADLKSVVGKAGTALSPSSQEEAAS